MSMIFVYIFIIVIIFFPVFVGDCLIAIRFVFAGFVILSNLFNM